MVFRNLVVQQRRNSPDRFAEARITKFAAVATQMRIGTDLVSISRVSNALETSPRFAALVYTAQELQIADSFAGARRDQFLAGRFAVKEAVLKALGVGIGDLSWMRNIEVQVLEAGVPKLVLLGSVAEMAKSKGLSDWQVSITHEAGLAAAFVMLR